MNTKISWSILMVVAVAISMVVYQKWQEPKDYEDCILKNMKDVDRQVAAQAIQIACDGEFPGRRSPNGPGYVFYIADYGLYPIDGPVPTATEKTEIDNITKDQLLKKVREEEIEEKAKLAVRPVDFSVEDRKQSKMSNIRLDCSSYDPGCLLRNRDLNFTLFNGSSSLETRRITIDYTFVKDEECPKDGYYTAEATIRIPPHNTGEVSIELPETILGVLRDKSRICTHIVSMTGY